MPQGQNAGLILNNLMRLWVILKWLNSVVNYCHIWCLFCLIVGSSVSAIVYIRRRLVTFLLFSVPFGCSSRSSFDFCNCPCRHRFFNSQQLHVRVVYIVRELHWSEFLTFIGTFAFCYRTMYHSTYIEIDEIDEILCTTAFQTLEKTWKWLKVLEKSFILDLRVDYHTLRNM